MDGWGRWFVCMGDWGGGPRRKDWEDENTLGAFGFLFIHGEFSIRGEEGGVVIVDVGVVGDGVVFLDEIFDGGVGDGVG